MKLPSILATVASVSLIFCSPAVQADEPVRVQGVSTLTQVLKATALPLREKGIEIKIKEECGNAQAVAALGAGQIDLALLARALTAEERATYPERRLEEYQLGSQTIALLVSRAIWESGVRALKRAQVAELYEGRVGSWKQLGGEDRSPKFFEPEHGKGTWEIFATWLYEDQRKAPAVPWDIVADGREAQTAVQFHSGAIAVAGVGWADGRDVFPLAIIDEAGAVIEPTPANVVAGKYPLARPVFIVVGDKPTGNRRKIIEFLRSEAGQAVVAGQDLVPMPPPAAP